MTAPQAYVLPLPRVGQRPPSDTTQKNLSALGVLGSDSGAVEPISTEPGTQEIRGYYRGRYAWKLARELKELASVDGAIPIYGARDSDADGYYAIDRVEADAVEAQAADWLQQYTLAITREGSRANKRRAVRTNRGQVDHPFGNATTAEVGVPAAATQVQWLDRETGDTSTPSLVATRSAELGDVEIYDLQAAPYANATLTYDLDYASMGDVDVRVWDYRGVGSRTDSDGVVAAAKVFSTAHEYAGERVISNGLVRLRVDQSPALSVERWDDANSTWTTQSLGTSSWSVTDIDIRHIGMARADARVVFSDGSSEYPLDVSVKRGWTDPLWMEVDGEGGTKPGVKDLLDPAASGQIYDPGADQGLVAREVVQ
ncbi:hypothetical protein [Haloarcula pellucida]|uniref:Uncharacterized protein n=1 Tax=Haloarcula pellucida TaxID=1427151 RepID=A0A830GS04_9EURY|nr:hypothetical protein [Halomicroarcula pellucida]MBX0350389.1 hypothetical protein [Halomicroarcula pellucida]GGO01861.1 hypothetical protein GCM10009030_35940 [Halomicroarcula pellucida]